MPDHVMTLEPQFDLMPDALEGDQNEVQVQVWGLLTMLYPNRPGMERRRETRYPFPYLIRLTPVGADGATPSGESIAVVGKHLSVKGLGFYHPKPLSYRRVIATIDMGKDRTLDFLVDLNWCRFTKHGWYESGGRFLQAVLPPHG